MLPVSCSQGFSIIWPTDLVFDPTWPILELDRDIIKMIILSKSDEDWTKSVACRVFPRFFYDLTYWPSFWSDMTHIRTWDKHSDIFFLIIGWIMWPVMCSQGLTMIRPTGLVFDPTWPIFKPDRDFIKANILTNFHDDGCIMWPVLCSQDFSIIWPTDLVFDLTWPIFELDRDIGKMIYLSKFDEDWTKIVAGRVFPSFFYDLTYWPSFWSDMTHIQPWLRFHQDKHSDKFSWCLDA